MFKFLKRKNNKNETLDGINLSEGEKDLIRSIRKSRISNVYPLTTIITYRDENGVLKAEESSISFDIIDKNTYHKSIKSSIIDALLLISVEQKTKQQ